MRVAIKTTRPIKGSGVVRTMAVMGTATMNNSTSERITIGKRMANTVIATRTNVDKNLRLENEAGVVIGGTIANTTPTITQKAMYRLREAGIEPTCLP